MTFGKLVVADVNGDGFDDVVAIGTDLVDSNFKIVVDVYLNEAKVRGPNESVNFIRQRLVLSDQPNVDASNDGVRFSGGFDLQVTDLDGDGKPDILASDATSGEVFVLWNQGANAPAPFVFATNDSDPTSAPAMAFVSPLAIDASFGGAPGSVLGTPVYIAAANLGEGSGRKSIIAYHGGLQTDQSSSQAPPFNQRNYESMAIIYPTGSGRGFDITKQRAAWPGCDLAIGSTCAGWDDGMPPNTSLYNFRVADQLRLNFDSAASDIITQDSISSDGTNTFYTPATIRPNASTGLQILPGHGPNEADSVWMQGGGRMNEFVADNEKAIMRLRTVIDAATGNERTAGATFGKLSTGELVLISAGGQRVVYQPEDATSAVTQPVPDFLNRNGQVGAWLNWISLDAGRSALMSMSDYCRTPDPCTKQFSWYHLPLDGSPAPASSWGASRTLVMLDIAQEIDTPSGKQFRPFFQAPDESHFQAFSMMGGALSHKPFVSAGHFASTTESALLILDHVDGAFTDANYNHFALYRPDIGGTYASPTPTLEGLTIGRFIQDGLADIGNALPKGETSAVLIGSDLGTDTPDGIRYVTVHDKATGAVKGIFPVSAAENVKQLSKDGIVVAGLSSLDIGTYTLEVHNATAAASMDLNVVNPFGLTRTDYDLLAGRTCGLLPNTQNGDLWPARIPVSLTGTLTSIDAVRWINIDDGTTVNSGPEGATLDPATSTVTLIVPQDNKLHDGHWRAAVYANGVWQPLDRSWNVTRDSSTLLGCAQQVNFVNEEAYSQCTNDDYYMDAAQYTVWPHLATGSFRFFGSGFAQNSVQSAAIKQGDRRYFSVSLQRISDNEIDVEFGDRSSDLIPDAEMDLYFYSETGDVVAANGVSAVGGKLHWRTPRKGTCVPSMPEITDYLNTGSGSDGTWQSGDTIKVSGKNILYPVPAATKLLLKGDDGSIYVLENPRLPDDWYTQHYDNDNMVLYFTIPDDLSAAKMTGDSARTAALAGGLVVAGSGALATTAVSEGGLAALLSNPVTAIATIGSTVTGLSIYAGVENSIWLYKKIDVALAKRPPTDISKPGMSGDDEEPDPIDLYLVTYVVAAKPAEFGMFAAVFESTAARSLSAAKFAIFEQGRGRYFNTSQIAECNDDVVITGPIPGVTACIVKISSLLSSNIFENWVPYVVTTNKWLYIDPSTGVVYDTQNYQSASAAIAHVPNIFAPMSPGGQFFWQAFPTAPKNYTYIQTNKRLATFELNQSNDCRLEFSSADYCYEQGVSY